ncbi:alpha/beta hydrolase [Mucilaginibacter rubeus]|uniref:Alpha/beta hydrolase n=1 Tax=Mucilaginibacter rubeus TaxID=2027860 RepID=A0AAE6MM82_9SPHI|nr:alpha/beta hydrolase [Mucilaginibacter rubeus]QEM20744.1 alpha/beta hydrolase [Mucilaginibacter gossypii]
MKNIKTDLLEIAYLEAGKAGEQVVLLLHGWPDDATTWNDITLTGYRTIAPFYRGFGQTRFLDEKTPRTGNAARLALDMIAMLDALGIEQFLVIGHDWGSTVAETLVVGWPERVKKIAQVSTPSLLGGLQTPPFSTVRLYWYQWFQCTARGVEAVKKYPIGFARIMWETWSPEGWFNESIFERVSQSWQNPDFADVTLHSYRSRWGEDELDPSSQELEEKVKATKTLSLPALYIQGEADGVTTLSAGEKVKEKFTGPYQRITLPGVGHFPSREAPEKLAGILLEFLTND